VRDRQRAALTERLRNARLPAVTVLNRRIRVNRFWLAAIVLLAICLGSLAVIGSQVRAVTEPSTSMEPAIMPGDGLLVLKGAPIRRGDIVLYQSRPAGSTEPELFVRRVIGLPGDRVTCCDADGQITVDGKALRETYVYPGETPSRIRFSITLRAGQAWLLGDHRNIARDSRLTGPAAMSGILGRVSIIVRNGHRITVRAPQTFITDGLAPVDQRQAFPYAWLMIAAVSGLALIVLLLAGLVQVIRKGRRRRRAGRQLSASTA
jgi:signal peptidase I